MNRQALGWTLAVGLLLSAPLPAQPINDLLTRVASMRNDQPTRMKVEIELRHRGTAPLHLNRTKRRGVSVIESGPDGVRKITSRYSTRSALFSFWRKAADDESSLVSDVEAEELVDPAGMMEAFLSEAVLLSDENVTWRGRPARLLVVRPAFFERRPQDGEAPADGGPGPLVTEVRIWLDESGVPLAMERGLDFQLGPALSVTGRNELVFQQLGGRLLVAEARETYSGTGLAVLRSRDERKMKVLSVE